MHRVNRVKRELSRGNTVCGCMVAEMRTPAIGMILECAGLDFFIIDMEHGSFNYETTADIIVSCHGMDIVPFVRVPGIDRESFQKVLDAGALGLLVPRIETAEEAAQAADLLRYAPEGSRGLSLRRAHTGFSRPDPARFTSETNRNIMLMLQIETRRGVENIDAISGVSGIDVLFIGPSDLGHSYGDGSTAEVERAIERVVQVGKERGIATGIHHSSLPYVRRLMAAGMQFFSLNTEVGVIVTSFSEAVEALRAGGEGGTGSQPAGDPGQRS